MKVDKKRAIFVVGAATASALAGYFFQPFVHDHDKVVGIVIDVFAILAGFLITIMTLLGEPGVLLRTWRSDAAKLNNIRRRLRRHAGLFYLYMTTLLVAFIYSTIDPATCNIALKEWLERLYLALACLAFLLSLRLPMSLAGLQLARYEDLVDARKKGAVP